MNAIMRHLAAHVMGFYLLQNSDVFNVNLRTDNININY